MYTIRRHEPVAAKVPEITASFWVLRLLTTAMGESASDYLLSTMSYVGRGLGAAVSHSPCGLSFGHDGTTPSPTGRR